MCLGIECESFTRPLGSLLACRAKCVVDEPEPGCLGLSSAAAMPMMEGEARRRYPRYQVSVPFDLTVVRPSAVMQLSGEAQDLGVGGLSGFISDVALPGERVELTLVLPGSSEPLNMHAVVRHEADLYCGFEFLTLEHAHREALQQLAADPDLQASLINEAEWESGMQPLPHGDAEICAECGEELPEQIPVCLACGAPRSDETASAVESPAGELAAADAHSQPASAKARRRLELDTLIVIIFLITFLIGLWEWLEAPAQTGDASQPSAIVVAVENALLRPSPAKKRAPSALESKSNSLLAETDSLVSAIIGGAFPATVQAAGERPQSAAINRRSQQQPPSVSNSWNNSSAPGSGSSLSSMLLNSPPPVNTGLAAESNSGSAGTPINSPSNSNLVGMLLQKVLPVYPAQARREGVQGQVVLKAVIAKDGTIASLSPLQGPQQLTAAAIDAVRHWRFRPYQLNGKPVEVETNIRLNFQLPKNK